MILYIIDDRAAVRRVFDAKVPLSIATIVRLCAIARRETATTTEDDDGRDACVINTPTHTHTHPQ